MITSLMTIERIKDHCKLKGLNRFPGIKSWTGQDLDIKNKEETVFQKP